MEDYAKDILDPMKEKGKTPEEMLEVLSKHYNFIRSTYEIVVGLMGSLTNIKSQHLDKFQTGE